MSVRDVIQAAAGYNKTLFVDDVFSTFIYEGNGSTQSITTNVNLSTSGGLTFIKNRFLNTDNWQLVDTVRGPGLALNSTSTGAESSASNGITSFSTSGFNLGTDTQYNATNQFYLSWSLRRAKNFFDIVEYSGDGTTSRNINHNLTSTPGMIIVKRTDVIDNDWKVWHTTQPFNSGLFNSTAAFGTTQTGLGTPRFQGYISAASATTFTVVSDTNNNVVSVNDTGGTYIAYLFGNDTSTSSFIKCGTYSATGNDVPVNLDFVPQWVLVKRVDATGDWAIIDSIRGLVAAIEQSVPIFTNSNAIETIVSSIEPDPGGFRAVGVNANYNSPGGTYLYVAIRKSNKIPTSGTQVFQPVLYTGTNTNNRLVNTTIQCDMTFCRTRTTTATNGVNVANRNNGQRYFQSGNSTNALNTLDGFDQQLFNSIERAKAFSSMNGFYCGISTSTDININTTTNNIISETFKQAAGFFDIVNYVGNSVSQRQVKHSLGVTPDWLMVKKQTGTGSTSMAVRCRTTGMNNNETVFMNSNAAQSSVLDTWGGTTIGDSTTFTLGQETHTNLNLSDYTAYLFASLPGISKADSYVGNGTSLTVNCGFATGARFVLIKNIDAIGDWYLFDSARGINADTDPYFVINSTAAENNSFDIVDQTNVGFIVNQEATTTINTLNQRYIYLAIA